MPELPEVETVKRAIADAALAHRIADVLTSDKKMRWPIPKNIKNQTTGLTIHSLERRGKYILLNMGDTHQTLTMILHLGMSGSIRLYPRGSNAEPKKHDHLTIRTESAESGVTLVLNDPRRFGGVQLIATEAAQTHPLLNKLGVEPLGADLNPEMLARAFKNKSTTIKTALLDQRIIAGIGNIYASEALFRAGVSPKRLAKNLAKAKLPLLTKAIKSVLEEAIAQGGTSLKDHIQPGGEIGYFAQSLDVYGRTGEPCRQCSGSIKEIRQAGRASFYCPKCQK